MNYKLVEITPQEHDDFVKSCKYGEVTQLYNWQYVKKNWQALNIGVQRDGDLIAVALILLKKLPVVGKNLAYIAKGPAMDYDNLEDVKGVISALKQFCKEHKCFSMKMDPVVDINTHRELLDTINIMGAKHQGLEKGFLYTQPRYYMICDIDKDEKEVLNSFQPRTRSLVKKSMKNGLICEKCGRDELPKFAEIMKITGERDEFTNRDLDYFERVYDSLSKTDDVDLYLTKLIPEDVESFYKNELKDIESSRNRINKKLEKEVSESKKANFTNELEVLDNREKRAKDLISQMEEHKKNKVTEIVLSGALLTFCGEKAYYLYGASSNDYRDLSPNYLMQWTMMREAMSRGCTSYDFGGVTGFTPEDKVYDHDGGLYEFKKRFGTYMLETIGEFDIVIDSLMYKMFNTALNLRKSHLQAKKKKNHKRENNQ